MAKQYKQQNASKKTTLKRKIKLRTIKPSLVSKSIGQSLSINISSFGPLTSYKWFACISIVYFVLLAQFLKVDASRNYKYISQGDTWKGSYLSIQLSFVAVVYLLLFTLAKMSSRKSNKTHSASSALGVLIIFAIVALWYYLWIATGFGR
jgi:ABC-type Na+ efflux pump permease subunit